MRRIVKIGFPIVCIAIIAGTFILLNKTTEKINKNKMTKDEEMIADNIFYEENVEVNTENEVVNENTTITPNTEEAKAQEIDNKAKAIEIVKKLAPPLTNVYYTNEGNENGLYIVAIRNNDTKIPNIIYAVDVENEKIEIYTK